MSKPVQVRTNRSELERVALLIRSMSIRSEFYKMLKRELKVRGWWKGRPRGSRRSPGGVQEEERKHVEDDRNN